MTHTALLPDNIQIFEDRATMGRAAGTDIGQALRARLTEQDRVSMVFAAAPSQTEVLETLIAAPNVDWGRVDAFHMDEYIGLPSGSPELFGEWLKEHLFDHVPFGSVNVIPPQGDPDGIAAEYAKHLGDDLIDVVVCGIGVNGHIAFNDPPVADFADPLDVKVVELDAACRQQQVDDRAFDALDLVPTHAITLTVPRLLKSSQIFCVVPGSAKARAVTAMFTEPISTEWPSTILREHPSCAFYFDRDSAAGLR